MDPLPQRIDPEEPQGQGEELWRKAWKYGLLLIVVPLGCVAGALACFVLHRLLNDPPQGAPLLPGLMKAFALAAVGLAILSLILNPAFGFILLRDHSSRRGAFLLLSPLIHAAVLTALFLLLQWR